MAYGITTAAYHQTRLTGKAGEHAVAAQLLLRGANVFFPGVDQGVDLLTESGCRIQVKAARLSTRGSVIKWYPEGVYCFHFPARKFVAASGSRVRSMQKRPFHEYCDIVVLWGIDHNRFWIVPADLLSRTQAVYLGPSNMRGFEKDIPEMRAMVEMGMSQKEIGEHFGIKQSSVGKRLQQAGTQTYGDTVRCAVRSYENAWENIIDFQKVRYRPWSRCGKSSKKRVPVPSPKREKACDG